VKEKVWKPIDIPCLPEGCPVGMWGESLQLSRVQLSPVERLTEGQRIGYEVCRSAQELCLHWVYKKKWNPRHPIPGYRKRPRSVKLIEPLADIFLAWLNLCEALHTIQPCGYVNAGEWFSCIAREIDTEILSALFKERGVTLVEGNVAAAQAKKIRKGENPFDPDRQPHQHRAAEVAIALRTPAPQIYRSLFQGRQRQASLGLGAAYSAFATSRERDGHISFEIKDGEFLIATGRGKSRSKLVRKIDG
jgi:hypothetical protein